MSWYVNYAAIKLLKKKGTLVSRAQCCRGQVKPDKATGNACQSVLVACRGRVETFCQEEIKGGRTRLLFT